MLAGGFVGSEILTISEDHSLRNSLVELLALAGFVEFRPGGKPSAILLACGNRIPKNDLALARAASGQNGGAPLILITSRGSEELAIEALRLGMANYLRLPLTSVQLAHALASVIKPDHAKPDDANPHEAKPHGAERSADRIIGGSDAIRGVKAWLNRAAACTSNVLITGETGTGKELAAEFIHANSSRASHPLITINCAAIPDSLLESELFGYERGAFTGAHSAQDGKLKLADGGTVFLDEIGDLSSYAQAKVLRAIESGEIQRLGGRRPQKIDVRLIAATNRDLETDPGFRRDLYFRLNVARVHLPPLRERRDDIAPLAETFRREFDRGFGCVTEGFVPGVYDLLMTHDWPGNVRELRNVIEAGFVDPGPDTSRLINLPPRFRTALRIASDSPQDHTELERILQTLSRTEWNRSRAAKELHWSRMTLYRKMAQYSIRRMPA